MKTCRKCSLDLPLIAFSRNKSFPDGLSTWCKKCRSQHRRDEYAAHHPGRVRAASEPIQVRKNKLCIDCLQELPVSHFHRKRSAADGYTSYCKNCGNARSIKWQRENKDKITFKRWEYRKASPRWTLNTNLRDALARRPTDNPANIDDLMVMWNRQDGKCALSGVQMTWAQGKVLGTSITLDRINHEGGYSADNLRLVCHAVNAFRGRMTDAEMIALARLLIAKADADSAEPSWRGFGYSAPIHTFTVN